MRLALLTLLLTSAVAFASQQDDLEKLRQRITSLQKDFEKANESKAEVADDLRESERAISDSNRSLEQLAQQQRAAKKDLAGLQQRVSTLRSEMREQQALLGRLLYRQYLERGRPRPPQAIAERCGCEPTRARPAVLPIHRT